MTAVAFTAAGGVAAVAQDRAGISIPGFTRTGGAASLNDDKRLDISVTVRQKAETVSAFLERLSKLTGVSLRTTDSEIAMTLVSYRYRKAALRDILESLAAINALRWKYDQNRTWMLVPSSHEMDILRPHTDSEAELYRLGRQFLEQFRALPADVQRAMWHDRSDTSRKAASIPLAGLPASMQGTVDAMVDASNAIHREWNEPVGFDPKGNSRLSVSFDGMLHGEYVSYNVNLGRTGLGGMGMNFNVFPDPNEDYHIVPRAQMHGTRAWMPEKEDAKSRGASLRDSRMLVKTSLSSEDALFPLVMQGLAVAKDLDYLLPVHGGLQFLKGMTFRFTEMPLSEVLDGLCALNGHKVAGTEYGYCWGRRESGIVIFHCVPLSALNPAKQ
jgi:hypothetical protein